ncbi:helix-turn-helix domain-containing protein [Oceanicella sp. SM1341]|uniref:helix-turn-helix domain-containing protein n=1 Tax=Oceanicella sp. SM1341 TaxID=1548889 RepID=UPI001E34DEE0|nr:helix-turn-helix transcriptional regulator [Oceanicella sp. SM1341]
MSKYHPKWDYVNANLDIVQMKPAQLRMARAATRLSVRDLAELSGVTANTISRIENGSDAKQSTLDRLRATLEKAGVEFIPENGGGIGVRLKE